MLIPARILRTHAMDVDPTLRHLSEREIEREERIIACAQHLIVRFGAAAISFTNLALAIRISPTTMRMHFADFHALLGEIMRRHLKTINAAMAAVPRDAPDRPQLQRAAYIEATRFLGAPNAPHLILITYRTMLPDDERESVDSIREQIGMVLAGADGGACLSLLDNPCFDLGQIEAMLHTAFCTPETIQAEAAPPAPAEQPAPHAAALRDEHGNIDYARISGVDIPGGKLCSGEPYKPPPWDTTHALRHLSDAELQRLRGPPKTIAA
jgi:AcrR family transcriptional regulator